MNIPALTSRCSVLPSTELCVYEFAVPLYVNPLCINMLICVIISKRWCIIISYKYIVPVSVGAILVAPKNKYSAPSFNSIKSYVTTRLGNAGTSTPGGYSTTADTRPCLWLNYVLWEFLLWDKDTVSSIQPDFGNIFLNPKHYQCLRLHTYIYIY